MVWECNCSAVLLLHFSEQTRPHSYPVRPADSRIWAWSVEPATGRRALSPPQPILVKQTGSSARCGDFTTFSSTLCPASSVRGDTLSSVSYRPGCDVLREAFSSRPDSQNADIQDTFQPNTHESMARKEAFPFHHWGRGVWWDLLTREMQAVPRDPSQLQGYSSHRTKSDRAEVRKQTHSPTFALRCLL